MEPHNIYLRLYTDGFNQFWSFIASYFCCPIILKIYNYLLKMCMKPGFMFLYVVILGPYNLGRNINICL